MKKNIILIITIGILFQNIKPTSSLGKLSNLFHSSNKSVFNAEANYLKQTEIAKNKVSKILDDKNFDSHAFLNGTKEYQRDIARKHRVSPDNLTTEKVTGHIKRTMDQGYERDLNIMSDAKNKFRYILQDKNFNPEAYVKGSEKYRRDIANQHRVSPDKLLDAAKDQVSANKLREQAMNHAEAIAHRTNPDSIAKMVAIPTAAIGTGLGIGYSINNYNNKNALALEKAEQARQAEQALVEQALAADKLAKENSGLWNRGYKWVSNLNPYLKIGLGLVAAGGLTYGAWRMTRTNKPRTQLKTEQVK